MVIRNILFLVADQWRGDTLGLIGTPGVVTPNLDALARRSVTFTNHWCQASPCGPSRRSLLTGTQLPTHGQWTNDDPAARPLDTVAHVARRAGLAPLLIGYTDTPARPVGPGPDGNRPPDVGGRDLYEPAFELVRPFFWQLGFPAYRAALEAKGYGPLDPDMMAIYPPAGEPTAEGLAPSRIAAEDSDVAWLTDAAIDVVTNRSEPWLLHLNWLRPHPPLVPPAPYHRLVPPDAVAPPLRPLSLGEQFTVHPFFALAGRERPMTEYLQRRCRIEAVTETDERQIRAAYYGLCAEVDHHLGRLLDALDRSGRAGHTLVVFTSDHGDALGDHGLYGRRGPFEGHFRVPCIIHDPRPEADATRGTAVEALTANIDLLPTMARVLDQPVPPEVDGQALTPFLEGAAVTPWRSHVRYEMDWTDHIRRRDREALGAGPHRFTVVRTNRHRYVTFTTDHSSHATSLRPLLFDLHEDPEETVNRANDRALAAVRQHLAEMAD